MATLEQARRLAERRIRDDGVVIDSPLLDRYAVQGNVAEVKSLSPARVELLSGREVGVDAYVGPVPSLGDLCVVLEIAQFRMVVTGIEVI